MFSYYRIAFFFIGCSSGPADIPKLFSINSCNVNHYTAPNAFNFMTGDLTSIKKIKYKKNKKLVPFDLLLKDPLAKNPSEKILEELGLFVEDNTSDEILQTVKEFINHRKKNILLQNKAKNSLSENNYSFNAKGNLLKLIALPYFINFLTSGGAHAIAYFEISIPYKSKDGILL